MKVYISGKITGLAKKESELKFKEASDYIASFGHTPINPVDLFPSNPTWSYADYMREDIRELIYCDAIYMISNWQTSKGAILELRIAKALGLKVIYQETE